MYKAFIWDFDGTLFNSYPAMVDLLYLMLEEEGLEPDKRILHREMKKSMGDAMAYCQQHYGVTELFIQRYTARREAYDVENSLPFPGALEACQAIAASGNFNFLFTHRGENAVKMMEIHGFLPLFRENITAAYPFRRKPDPEGIAYLIGKYALNPSEILMIGDRDLDLLAGKNAGTATCYFNEMGMTNPIADINFSHFSALKTLIGL